MKKTFTKLMALAAIVLLGAGNVTAQDDVYIYFGDRSILVNSADPSKASGDICSTTATSDLACIPSEFTLEPLSGKKLSRTGNTAEISITLNSTTAKDIVANVRGGGSGRTLSSIKMNDVSVTTVNIPTTSFGSSDCAELLLEGVNMQKGDKITFVFSGTAQLGYLKVTPMSAVTDPIISSFTIAGKTAMINNTAGTITAEVPNGTDLTSLAPTIALGGSATICSPTSGTAQDFSSPVTYTVSDGGTNTKDYVVTITVAPLSIERLAITAETTLTLSQDFVDTAGNDFITWSKGSANWDSRDNTQTCERGPLYVSNLSSTDRFFTIKVANVAAFDVVAYNTNSVQNRGYKVSMNATELGTVTHSGNNCETEYFTTGNTGNIDIEIRGIGNGTVYPLEIILYTGLKPTSITDLTATKTIQSVQYYDTLGCKVDASAQGLVIVKTVYEDGSSDVVKVYNTK